MTAANLRKLQSVQSKWIRSTSRKRQVLAHCQFSSLISSDKISKQQLESWLYFNKVWPCPQWLSCRVFFGEPRVLMVPFFVHRRRLTAFPQITIVLGQCCRRTISLLLDFREFVVEVLARGGWRTACITALHHGGKHTMRFCKVTTDSLSMNFVLTKWRRISHQTLLGIHDQHWDCLIFLK